MTRGIFYTTRAIGGREGPNISRHFTILRDHHATVDFLTGTKTNASSNLINKLAHIAPENSLNLYGQWYSTIARNMADWMEVYQSLDVGQLADYDSLYLICGVDLHRSNLGRFENRAGVFPRDQGQLKFESAGIHLTNILALLKAHREYGIPLHEVTYDPNEMSIDLFHKDVRPLSNYHLYHGYDIPLYNAKRLDSLQAWFRADSATSSKALFSQITKDIDFTFGYTVLKNSGRENYPTEIQAIADNFKDVRIFVKNEYTGENTHVDGETYLRYVERSRFTLMLPSYNAHCFSIYRFLESIYHDCLPLIHSNCNLDDVSKSYGVDFSPLVVDKNFIIPTESQRLEILENLKAKMLSVTKKFR